MRRFLEWWVLFLIQVSGIFLCYYFDIVEWVWTNDSTKISFLIVFLWLVITIKCGYITWIHDRERISDTKYERYLETGWFTSDQLLSLGMLGTVLGFLMMMGSITSSTDISAIQEMLKTMSTGMSTALVTTAVGMIFGNLLKFQLFLISREI